MEERVELVRQAVLPLANVEAQPFSGLAVVSVRGVGARVMLRGIRTTSDMEYEFTMSLANLALDPEVETVFLMAKESFSHISRHAVAANRHLRRRTGQVRPRPCEGRTLRASQGARQNRLSRGVANTLALVSITHITLTTHQSPMPVLPQPQPQAFDLLMRAQGAQRCGPTISRPRRERNGTSGGPSCAAPCRKRWARRRRSPASWRRRSLGTLKRAGYRIEKVIFQSRPDVWVTANLYVPDPAKGKVPAVLVVHGHWAGARRDPVVQARCLGLVKLGFFVLAVDAFGAGERYTEPAPRQLPRRALGSTLWPAGHTLLGMQVYDNRRAVDYLPTRPEVDGARLGITGASGGGNQTMYAGALDERFGAVVPVCSVGNYQAYLQAACCVCEVLPGALRFTEEGDVLGLVAPRP